MNNTRARKGRLSNEEVERDIELNMSSKEGQEMIGRRHSLSTSSRIRKVNHELLIVLIVLGSSTLG